MGLCGGELCTCIQHANIHAGVLVDVCVFPPRMLQSRSRRGMADGGCESEFQSGLTDRGVSVRDVVSPGSSVAGGVWTEQRSSGTG